MLQLIQALDTAILLFIQEFIRFSWLDLPMIAVSTLGNAGLIWIVLGIVLVLYPKTRKYGTLALLSLLVCFIFNNLLLKNLIARPRPYTQIAELVMLMDCPNDFSFPSGHTCAAFATAGSLLWSMDRQWNKIRIPSLVIAVWMGFSRLYVGVHYPTDVIAAALIGLLGSRLVCHIFAPRFDRLAKRKG